MECIMARRGVVECTTCTIRGVLDRVYYESPDLFCLVLFSFV